MNILITGTSRGIGLEFVRYCMAKNWRVFACCRHPQRSGALIDAAKLANGRVSLHVVDMSELATIQALAYELRNEPIDILINNAGIYGSSRHRFGSVDAAGWQEAFQVNTIAPLKMVEAFSENLVMRPTRTVACLSSKMGSIADNGSGGSYIYRSSKAALNAVVKSLSIDLKLQGICTVALHPGWVKTDMGGPDAEIGTGESVERMMAIIENLELADSGRFIDIDGSDIPW